MPLRIEIAIANPVLSAVRLRGHSNVHSPHKKEATTSLPLSHAVPARSANLSTKHAGRPTAGRLFLVHMKSVVDDYASADFVLHRGRRQGHRCTFVQEKAADNGRPQAQRELLRRRAPAIVIPTQACSGGAPPSTRGIRKNPSPSTNCFLDDRQDPEQSGSSTVHLRLHLPMVSYFHRPRCPSMGKANTAGDLYRQFDGEATSAGDLPRTDGDTPSAVCIYCRPRHHVLAPAVFYTVARRLI
ncbi:hypothetical protein U9M48_023613 [Paspalum notatum var. saurae]|uniref:Uncharacterized protein n=1 Tax=Paspalum notatum var. saurae TaxID=547442 RepID=A0AAQ3TM79_PASNO